MGSSELNARCGYSFLTGFMQSMAVSKPELKKHLLETLIKCHTENPISFSAESIEEWKKEVVNG